MDIAHLDLKIREGCQELYIEFHADGADLGTRIEEALGEAGFDDVLPWYGGDYSISETVLGEEARTSGAAESAILLACGCGQYACGGVSADVHVTNATITLSKFSTWRQGEWIVAALDPVVFDRGQFEEAIHRLKSMIEEWRPPPENAKAAGREGDHA